MIILIYIFEYRKHSRYDGVSLLLDINQFTNAKPLHKYFDIIVVVSYLLFICTAITVMLRLFIVFVLVIYALYVNTSWILTFAIHVYPLSSAPKKSGGKYL